jgi:hypothetical protein
MLMGGSTDVNAAFRWFNGLTNGGDVVVLRYESVPVRLTDALARVR